MSTRVDDAPSSDRLLDWQNIAPIRVPLNKDFDSFAELYQLISYISYSGQRLYIGSYRAVSRQAESDKARKKGTNLDLYEMLIRPRNGETRILPLLPNVE